MRSSVVGLVNAQRAVSINNNKGLLRGVVTGDAARSKLDAFEKKNSFLNSRANHHPFFLFVLKYGLFISHNYRIRIRILQTFTMNLAKQSNTPVEWSNTIYHLALPLSAAAAGLFKETACINKCLAALGDVICALASEELAKKH